MQSYMPSKLILKVSASVAISGLAYHLFLKLYIRMTQRKITSLERSLNRHFYPEEPDEQVCNKVLFFPNSRSICRKMHLGLSCNKPACRYQHRPTSMTSVVQLIHMAKKKIDVCLFLFTSNVLGDALVQVHGKGVHVCVMIDRRHSGDYENVSGSQIEKMRNAGIKVIAVNELTAWLHHKFMIVDDQVLSSGSFNWTNNASLANVENIIITSEPELVEPFKQEFKRLCSSVSPENITN